MSATFADRDRVRRTEIAVECLTIAEEVERLAVLIGKRASVLRSQAKQLAGELDGVAKHV